MTWRRSYFNMKAIYLDNAATTPMLPEVIEVMCEAMQYNFGNPSSVHRFGRKAKSAIENARKSIAKHFNVSASEIVFTSSATEANNLILYNAVESLKVKTIITSKLEHHAVLQVIEYLQKAFNIKVCYVNVDEFGRIDLQHLEELVAREEVKTLVSLMYINNEIGNKLSIDNVCEICERYNVLFHSDTVQAIGHYQLDLQKTPIDFITASAHKFHGPKGIGFLYAKKGLIVNPMLYGGGQEKGKRSGTENVHAILGMEKALDVAISNLEEDVKKITALKMYLIEGVKKFSPAIEFNGKSGDLVESSCAILNVRFPIKDSMLLFQLDLLGISVSGGSACQSGGNRGSHVLQSFLVKEELEKTSVRFSFSKYNTQEEIDVVLEKITSFLQ